MESTLCWLSITPFGSPVEPEEKRTRAGVSAVVFLAPAMRRNGADLASRRLLILVPAERLRRMSSM